MRFENWGTSLIEDLRPFFDFLYFAPRCLSIRTKSGKIAPLRLNKAQQYLHAKIEEQRRTLGKVRVIGLKGRQQGFSSYTEARFYHKTCLGFGKRAVVMTHLQDSTDALFEMVKRYHEHCPERLRPETEAASAKEFLFSGRDSGYTVATAGSRGIGRGRTVQYLHASEMAFWRNAEDHFAGIGQTVPDERGTEIIVESTANGVGNLFHGLWQDAMRGCSEYLPIFVPWFWQEEYQSPLPEGFVLDADEAEYAELYSCTAQQMAWRRKKIQDDFRGDEALFDQEYPATPALAFQRVAGDPYITVRMVERARGVAAGEPRGARIMGVDVAEYGEDDTAICFRQGRLVHPVKTWHGKGPMEVVGLVAIEADAWKPDLINVDCTGVGSGVADRLIELGYPVQRVHFGSRAIKDEIYRDRRAEMYGELREWLEDLPACLPDDDVLVGELTSVQYSYDSSRRVVLESKEQMGKRGIKSPDRADAVALTFAVKIAPKAEGEKKKRRSSWRI